MKLREGGRKSERLRERERQIEKEIEIRSRGVNLEAATTKSRGGGDELQGGNDDELRFRALNNDEFQATTIQSFERRRALGTTAGSWVRGWFFGLHRQYPLFPSQHGLGMSSSLSLFLGLCESGNCLKVKQMCNLFYESRGIFNSQTFLFLA